jgi:hypothetical protein
MPFAPSESPQTLFAEESNLLATYFGAWAHGTHHLFDDKLFFSDTDVLGILFSVTFLCLHTLLTSSKEPPARRLFNIGFVCLSFLCGTWGGIVNVVGTIRAFVYSRGFPGGPIAYEAVRYSNPFSVSGFSAFVVATWLQDGYLVCCFLGHPIDWSDEC